MNADSSRAAALRDAPPKDQPPHHATRLEEIDVLRGLAALAVVVFHYSGHCQRYFAGFPFYFEYGKYGVQLFFVISGFFIFLTVERCRNAREFLLLRFSRLYPVYWTTLAVLLAVDLVDKGGAVWLGGYMVNATMLQSFAGYPDIDIVYWSLAVEMAFYLLMAVLLASGWIRRPLLVALGWLALANLWSWVGGHLAGERAAVVRALAGVLVYGPFFIAGMMFYLMRKSKGRMLAGPASILLLCLLTACAGGGIFNGVVAAAAFASMALAMTGRLRFLVSPVTLWLGAISYSLYLVHRNLGYLALFKLNALGVDSRLSFVIVTCGALALASAFTYCIERPTLGKLRRWVGPRPAVHPVAEPIVPAASDILGAGQGTR